MLGFQVCWTIMGNILVNTKMLFIIATTRFWTTIIIWCFCHSKKLSNKNTHRHTHSCTLSLMHCFQVATVKSKDLWASFFQLHVGTCRPHDTLRRFSSSTFTRNFLSSFWCTLLLANILWEPAVSQAEIHLKTEWLNADHKENPCVCTHCHS